MPARMLLASWLMLTALLLLFSPAPLPAEPVVTGDLAVAAAIGDAMTTRLAELDRGGRMKFRHTRTGDRGGLIAEGEYLWDKDRDAFQGTIRHVPGAPDGPSNPLADHPLHSGTFTWFRTRTDDCLYNSEAGIVYLRTPHPHSPLLSLRLRLWKQAFHYYPHADSTFLLSECCAPTPALERYDVTQTPDGKVRLDILAAGAGDKFRSQLTADLRAGGHFVSMSGEPPPKSDWLRASFDWRQNAAGVWYPARIEHQEFPHGSFEKPLRTYVTEILEFSADAKHDPARFRFDSLKLPIGTEVTIARANGVEHYIVGGETGKRKRFEAQLDEAAKKVQSQGFASPDRESRP